MLAHAVVPERDRACLPTEPALDLCIHRGLVEMGEQPLALISGQPFDMRGEGGVDIDHPLARLGMRADYWVAHGRVFFVEVFGRFAQPFGEDPADIVDGGEPFAKPLHLLAKALISEVHIGKTGVAAAFGHFAREQDGAE